MDSAVYIKLITSPLIYLLYMGGNVAFLDAMRRRDAAKVKAFIVGNVTFAVALAILLVVSITANIRYVSEWNSDEGTESGIRFLIGWLIRTMSVVFIAASAAIYSQLWSGYDSTGSIERDDGGAMTPKSESRYSRVITIMQCLQQVSAFWSCYW